MKIILDMHGCIIQKFPIKEYHDKVYKLIPKKMFEILKERFHSGIGVFTALGMKKDYIKLINSLSVVPQYDKEMIETLQEMTLNHDLYLVTDSTIKNVLKTLKAAHIPHTIFSKILTLDSYPGKPDTKMYETVGWSLVVGDRDIDAIPALKLGYPCFIGQYGEIKYFLRSLNGWRKEKGEEA